MVALPCAPCPRVPISTLKVQGMQGDPWTLPLFYLSLCLLQIMCTFDFFFLNFHFNRERGRYARTEKVPRVKRYCQTQELCLTAQAYLRTHGASKWERENRNVLEPWVFRTVKPELENVSWLLRVCRRGRQEVGEGSEWAVQAPPPAPPIFGRVHALLGARQADTDSVVRFWGKASDTVLCSLPS